MAKEIVIQIDEEYRIEHDPLNSALIQHKVNPETGKERDDNIGYYANIRNALMAYVKQKRFDAGECESMEKYIEKLQTIDNESLATITKALTPPLSTFTA